MLTKKFLRNTISEEEAPGATTNHEFNLTIAIAGVKNT